MNSTRKTLLFAAASLTLASTACAGSAEETPAAEQPSAPASSAPQSASPQSASPQSPDPAAPAGSYADGEYSAQGTYTPPSNETEEVDVTLTLEGGVVTAVEVETSGNHPTSKQYQREFTSGIEAEVVGKSIDELDVDKVAGSSLTSTGFNKALETIRAEAAN